MATKRTNKVEPTEPDTFGFQVGEEFFSADDLTLGDIAEMEDYFNCPMDDFDWRRISVMTYFIWLVKRKSNKDLTLEEVMNTPLPQLAKELGNSPLDSPEADAQ